jgi:hypothetical protein
MENELSGNFVSEEDYDKLKKEYESIKTQSNDRGLALLIILGMATSSNGETVPEGYTMQHLISFIKDILEAKDEGN